jgi:signal transduction histidine kinase
MRAEIPEGLRVRVDRDRMMQVLVNLVSNAIKYNRDGGEVVIAAAPRHGESARVSISDTGIGMTREQMERIFDRFYRTQEAAAGAPGSGLGLAIAREILARHGSLLRAESREQKGSTFSVTLALAHDDDAPAAGDGRIEVAGNQRREE